MTTTAQKTETTLITIALKLDLDDLIAAVIAGMVDGPHGYGYWCTEIDVLPNDTTVIARGAGYRAEWIARNVLAGGTATCTECDDTTGELTPHTLTREKLVAGFGRWIAESNVMGVYDKETGITRFEVDAPASDAILQYALFGEQRYG